ncbi:hypothetical protein [Streptomyces sp. RPT161]|uniref:hypothetical protein n=1 Tax=Streptomyces sp. RPT161 TaxID=3015993 RepID=UPI0022B8B13C|nr:hypothetical protein [Streptomyces sp. RPT161]
MGRWCVRVTVGIATSGALVAGAPSAFAGGAGCNDRTCLSVDGRGLHVDAVSASTTWGGDFTGHFHIYGGGLNANSPTGFWGYHQKYTVPVGRDLPNHAVVCAEGWEHTGSGPQLRGRACEEVRS